MVVKYLYLFEEGSVGVGDEPPTEVDVQAIHMGVLSVVRLESESEVSTLWWDAEGICTHMDKAVIEDDPEQGPFHVLQLEE